MVTLEEYFSLPPDKQAPLTVHDTCTVCFKPLTTNHTWYNGKLVCDSCHEEMLQRRIKEVQG